MDVEDLIDVVFSVVIPKRCFEQSNSRVKICFLMDNTFTRLDLKSSQEMRNFAEYADAHQLLITVHFPKKLISPNYNIFYFYYCVNQNNENNIVGENNLLELKQLRHLSLPAEKKKVYLRYDGFALFNSIEYQNNSKELAHMKEAIVVSNVHIEALRHESIKEIHNDFMDKLISFYDSLCLNDDQYRLVFERVNVLEIFSIY
jgi:hypothetical protein